MNVIGCPSEDVLTKNDIFTAAFSNFYTQNFYPNILFMYIWIFRDFFRQRTQFFSLTICTKTLHHMFDMVSNTLLLTYRSSRSQMFFKIGVLKNFANFRGKRQCWSPPKQVFSCEIC